MSIRISSTDTQVLPYKGLCPYEEEDRENFFGRDADCRILIDKILANRVTLLFAAAGVGKSSLLQAKALPQLKDPQHENLDAVYYRDWVLSPLPTLKQHVLAALKERGRLEGDTLSEETKEDSLEDFFALCTLLSRQPLVIALDQFEEFFHNQRYTSDFKPFVEQLSAVINNRTIPITIIIAMREDFALELNAFRPFIPHLFENAYRLQRLTKNNAREAIAQPVQRIGFEYEPELLDKLLSDLVLSEQSAFFDTASFNPELMDMVDPVALQIVCSQLWDIEKTSTDKTFHLKTYEDKGGAEAFFRSYVEDIFKDFSPEQKYLAYQVFNHILTRRGTKVAFTLNSLKKILPDADEPLLQQLINDLQNKRILRYQWRKEEMWYEIYHDRFYHAIEKWSESYNQERAKELSRFLEEFFSMVAQFPRNELRLAALALDRLTADTSAQEGYSAHALAVELNEDGAELAGVLARLEAMHVVRKRPGDKGFVLYDDLFSGPIKQWNRNYHLRKKRIRRNFLIVMTVAATAIALIIYDLSVNFNGSYFYLSVKEGLAENVEIYRGKPKSLDIFNLQAYIAETDYRRLQIEPIMLFKEKIIKEYQELHEGLIGSLQPIERIEAYWRDGQTDTALKSVKQAIEDYPQRRQATIDILASFRSLETIKLAEDLRDKPEYRDLHEQIVTVMASLPTPTTLDILLANIKEPSPARIRRAAVEALENISHTDFGAAHVDKIKAALISLLPDQAREERLVGDEEALVMLAVARTLARLEDQKAVGQLRELAGVEGNTQIHWEIRSGAMEVLAGLRDANFVASLLNQVGNKSSDFRPRSTVGALGQMGGPDVVAMLLDLLKHNRVNIRRMAAEALGRTGDHRVSQSLSARLDKTIEDEPEVRRSIAEALGRLWNSTAIQPFLAVLMEMLQGEDNSPMNHMVMETLERIETAEMCQMLLDKLAQEGDTRKLRVIIHALGRLGDVRAIPPLARAISPSQALQTDATEAKDDVRQSTAEALARLGESAAVNPLIDVLKKEKGHARLHVVGALGRLGHATALKPLQGILQQGADRQDPVYLSALVALSQLGDVSALDHLTTWLRQGDSLMRRGNLETLVGSYTARQIESRISAQSGEEGYIRQAAVEALGRFDSIRPVDLLITRLSDGSIFVRRGAARALGRLGSRDIRVVELLIARLNDGDSDVRQYAAEALGHLRDRRAVTPLIALLQDATSDVRQYAAEALGRLGDDRALQPLLSQLQGGEGKRKDGVEEVRRAALLAYAKIGLKSHRESAGIEVGAVFKDAEEPDRVKLVAAVALLALRPTDPLEADIQAWLENSAGSVQTNRRKELADLLGEFPTAVGTRLLFRLLEAENRREDRNLSVQARALTALGLAQDQAALPELYTQLNKPNFRLQEAAAEALANIASAESIERLTAITSTSDPAVSIPTRLAGLKALYNIAKNSKPTDASRQQAIQGMLDAVQSRDGEAILGIRTYNLLGDLQARGKPLDYLQRRLHQEAEKQRKWRNEREDEREDATQAQTRPEQSKLKKAQSRPHLVAFELAYNIARIDPDSAGLQLLSRDLADIRRGAWLGLGTVGNVALLKKLRQERQHSDDPLFRHAAYQAIDHILLRLEAEEVDPQELRQLQDLYQTLCKSVSISAENAGICLRVEWTVTQLQAKDAINAQHSAEFSANQNQ